MPLNADKKPKKPSNNSDDPAKPKGVRMNEEQLRQRDHITAELARLGLGQQSTAWVQAMVDRNQPDAQRCVLNRSHLIIFVTHA